VVNPWYVLSFSLPGTAALIILAEYIKFINTASGSNLPVGRGLESCTSEVQISRPFFVDGRVVILIDTPGFDDTTRSKTDILTMIAAYLSRTYVLPLSGILSRGHVFFSYEHGTRLAGVIYMHRISDIRMGSTSKRNFKIFREICGESSLKNVLVVTNMWPEMGGEVEEAREAELASKDQFFKPALEKGAQLLRHGTVKYTRTILRYLTDSHPTTLRIQQEIVDERKPSRNKRTVTRRRSVNSQQNWKPLCKPETRRRGATFKRRLGRSNRTIFTSLIRILSAWWLSSLPNTHVLKVECCGWKTCIRSDCRC